MGTRAGQRWHWGLGGSLPPRDGGKRVPMEVLTQQPYSYGHVLLTTLFGECGHPHCPDR